MSKKVLAHNVNGTLFYGPFSIHLYNDNISNS